MKSPIKPEEIEYTALFVDNPEKLLKMFPAKHAKVFAHHSTNWYKPTSIEGLEIGLSLQGLTMLVPNPHGPPLPASMPPRIYETRCLLKINF